MCIANENKVVDRSTDPPEPPPWLVVAIRRRGGHDGARDKRPWPAGHVGAPKRGELISPSGQTLSATRTSFYRRISDVRKLSSERTAAERMVVSGILYQTARTFSIILESL